jgi:predicted amidophosphoribosyltransferase
VRCAKCGADNREGRKFCSQCGSALAAECRRCGTAAEPADKSVSEKIVVRLMKFQLPSSFRRSPIDRDADYPYAVG